MKYVIPIFIIIFLAMNLNANVLIYNYTPEKLTASFYYEDTPAKMEFSIEAGQSSENGIPVMSTKRRLLKIHDANNKELILGPYKEWIKDKIFYIVFENDALKAYTKEEWDTLHSTAQNKVKAQETKSLFSFSPKYTVHDSYLEDKIPENTDKNNWVMITNQYEKTMYCAFYYQGSLSGTLTKAPGPLYTIQKTSAGYAALPPSHFIVDGPRVIVYAEEKKLLKEKILKKDYKILTGISPVGFGQGNIVLISPESNEERTKKSILSIKANPLNIILKTDTLLYYALYVPEYKSWGESVKEFFNKKYRKIEQFIKYKGPEKVFPNTKTTIEASHHAVLAFSANPSSLAEKIQRSVLEHSPDITYAICGDNKYLIIAKPVDKIFIYTAEQWKDAINKETNQKSGVSRWILKKILG